MTDINQIRQRYVAESDTSGLDKFAAASTKKFSDASSTMADTTEKAKRSAPGVSSRCELNLEGA